MATGAIAGVGTLFQRYNGSVWVTIAEVNSIEGPAEDKDVIEVTSLDTGGGYDEFITGFINGGTVTLNMNFTRSTYEIMKSDFDIDVVRSYRIVLPDDESTSLEFEGLVTEIPITAEADNQLTADVMIQISGQVAIDVAEDSSVDVSSEDVVSSEDAASSEDASLASVYTAEYIAAVEADGGEIIDAAVVLSEYERLIAAYGDDLTGLQYAFHFKAGVKIEHVDFDESAGGGSSAAMDSEEGYRATVIRWYNMALNSASSSEGYDYTNCVDDVSEASRPEYFNDLGLRFRTTGFLGDTRCGLETQIADVLPALTGNIIIRGIIIPAADAPAVAFITKGYATGAKIAVATAITNNALTVNLTQKTFGTPVQYLLTSANSFWSAGVEVEFKVDANFDMDSSGAGGYVDIYKNTVLDKSVIMQADTQYPDVPYKLVVGASRDLVRTPWSGYIKQIELCVL